MDRKKITVLLILVMVLVLIISSHRFIKFSGNKSIIEPNKQIKLSDIFNKEYIYINEKTNTPTDITIMFNNDRISGSGGVNRYSSSYKIDGNTIEIQPIISTMMAGTQEKMNMETSYLKLLKDAHKITLRGDSIVINTKNNQILTFIKNTNAVNMDR